MPLPITVITDNDEKTYWLEAAEQTFIDVVNEGIQYIILDKENLSLDHNVSNNYYKTKGFKKLEKIRPQLFGGIEDPKRSQLFFSPMLAGNAHDKFMLGMAFYNRLYPAKNLEWDITPLYAFGSKQVNGILNLAYTQNIRRERQVQIKYGVHFKTFSYDNKSFGGRYLTVKPFMEVLLLPSAKHKNILFKITWKHYQSWKELNLQSESGG